jgi:hypothetical protein
MMHSRRVRAPVKLPHLQSESQDELTRVQNNIKIDGVVVLDFTDIYPNSS